MREIEIWPSKDRIEAREFKYHAKSLKLASPSRPPTTNAPRARPGECVTMGSVNNLKGVGARWMTSNRVFSKAGDISCFSQCIAGTLRLRRREENNIGVIGTFLSGIIWVLYSYRKSPNT
eukprot:749679-Hanusia_phi.AAC.4